MAAEREAFYVAALQQLLKDGALTRDMSVLVSCGGELDRDVFQSLSFTNVTITNVDDRIGDRELAPFRWTHADAESLPYVDESFDWGVVSAGLHHCRSPHRAMLELYRIARRGVLGIESRDSASMRLAIRLGLVEEYELTAVAECGLRAGGVANTPVPNYVYRWTEREVEKTIASFAPHAQHRFVYRRELEIPWSVVDTGGVTKRLIFKGLAPAMRALTRVAPSQANQFAFAVMKVGVLQPWLREVDQSPVPDEGWMRARLPINEETGHSPVDRGQRPSAG